MDKAEWTGGWKGGWRDAWVGGGRKRGEREKKGGKEGKMGTIQLVLLFDLMTLFADKEKLYPLSLNPN